MRFSIIPPNWKILCIDDEPSYILMYKKYLNEAGFQVTTADSAENGLKLLADYTPDLIITDLVMPGIDGIKLSQIIREDPRFETTIIVMISGTRKDGETAIQAPDTGADDYLLKPFNREEILAKIRSFLRIKYLQDESRNKNIQLEKLLKEIKSEKETLDATLRQLSIISDRLEEQNEKLKDANKQQEKGLESLVKILSNLIENRLKYHRGHAKKVAEISRYIAAELKIPEHDIVFIEVASLLHEIGKFGISDELIEKTPDLYSEAEKNILENHPVIGANLLENFPGFSSIADTIRHIHERYDGKGWPNKLKADAIPVGSRIIAAANFYESLIRQNLDIDIEAELETHSQRRFDPTVVKFLKKYIGTVDLKSGEKVYEIRSFDLEPQMILAKDVFTKTGIKPMPKDTQLTEELIERITLYNKIDPIETQIYIKG